jgi:uncharacterized iron-regulated membrane protein
MSWLHTWAGVVLGSVLFAVFWMGTLSVFDREIDRWMMPATRLGPAPEQLSLDRTVRPLAAAANGIPDGTLQWSAALPTDRTPTLIVRVPIARGKSVFRHVDPRTGRMAADQGTLGGTGFIYPFHFRLHLLWLNLGYWLVGLAAMAMLALLVSGVIIHRRIFKDFFTFRSRKRLERSSLDLHNVTGVLALPFHFVMTLSGLIIFFSLYFPGTWKTVYQNDNDAFTREVFGGYQRAKAGKPGPLASLDAMVAEAERRWAGGKPFLVRVWHQGDAASYVEVRRSYAKDVTLNRDLIYFDGATGAVLHRSQSKPIGAVQRFIAGIHFVQFQNWPLRWLYFAAGLAGCVMIGTGFLFWLESRRARHARDGSPGVRIVEAMTVGSVTGIVLATIAFFIGNRLLPLGFTFAGASREYLEMWIFYSVWILAFGHAAWRARAAWCDQVWAIAGLALAAVLANWLSTGDHILRALDRGLWAVAGMDLLLLLTAGVAGVVARRLARRKVAVAAAVGASGAAGVREMGIEASHG